MFLNKYVKLYKKETQRKAERKGRKLRTTTCKVVIFEELKSTEYRCGPVRQSRHNTGGGRKDGFQEN